MLKQVISTLYFISEKTAKLFTIIVDAIYSSVKLHSLKLYIAASFYIGFLIVFTHVDVAIDTINPDEAQLNKNFFDIMLAKHANFVSLVTNIGLLLFIILDMIVTFHKKATLNIVIVTNLIGVIACVVAAMCAMGATADCKMKTYGAIESETTA